MEQKFKRGNLVKVLSGHIIWDNKDGEKDISPKDVGKEAIIEGSYADMYGNGEPRERNSYSIIFMDNGTSLAWKDDNELELINEGGEHLFAKAKANREKLSKENTDLKRIKATWEEKQGALSSETILFLFEKIGHKSAFLSSGEFYHLHIDWAGLYPLFNDIMMAKTEAEANDLLIEGCPKALRERVISLFQEINS